ncbi:MAG TPA: hypothetical protein VK203_20070 [Nostocaceae cyanobacterium]|nr:hypothetical protein [Nostocaceae cyanobacterium]
MKNLVVKLLIASGLTLLGTVAFTNKSFAQTSGTATLTVSQTVANECNFSNLNYANNTGTIAKSGPYAASVTWTGSIGVTCNTATRVLISAALQSVNPGVTTARTISSYQGEYLSVNTARIWRTGSYSGVASVSVTPAASIPYEVSIVMNPGSTGPGLPSGSYGYTFVLTATPN